MFSCPTDAVGPLQFSDLGNDHGHFLELDNNTAERAVKPVAIGSKNWMFAASEGGGKGMAADFFFIEAAAV
ncbi:IS66 family transposase [Ruegeria hyattellae]|uniref:IS66 family transposase n=1 Tax=Ruegeria hyattellae TaxID=3233337 RepID=UPI00355BF6E5